MLGKRKCCCESTPCLTYFHVVGCNSLGLVGATVRVWTDSGKATLLATGTTGSSPAGFVQLDIGGPRTVYWEASKSRFVTGNNTATITTCGVDGGGTTTPAVASGYHCLGGGCADPIADTLHYTDYWGNTATLTYTGSGTAGWYGTTGLWNYPGCGSCAAVANYSYGIRLAAGAGTVALDWVRDVSGLCPGAATGPGYETQNNFIAACPPSVLLRNRVFNGESHNLFCLSPPASPPSSTDIVTITE